MFYRVMDGNKRIWERTDTRSRFLASSNAPNTSKPALQCSVSDSNVTTVISEELMKELNDRDKTLQQREKELEAKQKRFLDEKTCWNQYMTGRKEQLQRQFERDKTRFEEALVNATQRDLDQLVEEYECHRQALLAVIAVFHLKCIAFDISLFIQAHSKKGRNKPVQHQKLEQTPRASSTGIPTTSANISRCHAVTPVFLCWMTREMERLERRYMLRLQDQPVWLSRSVQTEKRESAKITNGRNHGVLAKMNGTPSKSHARSIFISILTFEAVSFISVLYFLYEVLVTAH